MCNTIPDYDARRTEAAGVVAMRMTVAKYAQRNHMSFSFAFYAFVRSGMYDDLFDPSLRLWAEGPDYLLDLWERREKTMP